MKSPFIIYFCAINIFIFIDELDALGKARGYGNVGARGITALGYTMQVPTDDRFLMKKTELLNRIATLLVGRAAEEMKGLLADNVSLIF